MTDHDMQCLDFRPTLKWKSPGFSNDYKYSCTVMIASNSSKQKKHSAMSSWLITRIIWITCFAIVPYALPVTNVNDAVVSVFLYSSFRGVKYKFPYHSFMYHCIVEIRNANENGRF